MLKYYNSDPLSVAELWGNYFGLLLSLYYIPNFLP